MPAAVCRLQTKPKALQGEVRAARGGQGDQEPTQAHRFKKQPELRFKDF